MIKIDLFDDIYRILNFIINFLTEFYFCIIRKKTQYKEIEKHIGQTISLQK